MQAYRFVVVYRGEPPSREGDAAYWRGWVEQVFPEPDDENARHFFEDPADVGPFIQSAVRDDADERRHD